MLQGFAIWQQEISKDLARSLQQWSFYGRIKAG